MHNERAIKPRRERRSPSSSLSPLPPSVSENSEPASHDSKSIDERRRKRKARQDVYEETRTCTSDGDDRSSNRPMLEEKAKKSGSSNEETRGQTGSTNTRINASAKRARAQPSRPHPQTRHKPTDEFQQVSRRNFVDRWKVQGMGYGADVYYQPEFLSAKEADEWYQELVGLDTYQPTLKMYGRAFPQSRQIAAYSTTPSATLSYSGSRITMNYPFPPILEKIRERLEDELGVRFNHVMLNRYDDGSVYIGKHSDNLNNLVIASVSVGAKRTFIMSPRLPNKARARTGKSVQSKRTKSVAGEDVNHKDEIDMSMDMSMDEEALLKGRKNVKWVLGNGSLVVMQGRTQEYWKHEIPKEPSVKDGRISLTFRQLV